MWLRFGGVLAVLLLILSSWWTAGAAWAVCSSDAPAPPGGFAWPLAAPVTGAYLYDCHSDRGHRGIDIEAAAGDPVAAAGLGMVSFVGYTPAEGGGLTVTVDHPGGLRTTYLHLSTAAVSAGEQVTGGQLLGASDGRPLHFGVKMPGAHDTYFDPLKLLPPLPAPERAAPQTEATQAPADSAYVPATLGPPEGPATGRHTSTVPVAAAGAAGRHAPVRRAATPGETPPALLAAGAPGREGVPVQVASSPDAVSQPPSEAGAESAAAAPGLLSVPSPVLLTPAPHGGDGLLPEDAAGVRQEPSLTMNQAVTWSHKAAGGYGEAGSVRGNSPGLHPVPPGARRTASLAAAASLLLLSLGGTAGLRLLPGIKRQALGKPGDALSTKLFPVPQNR